MRSQKSLPAPAHAKQRGMMIGRVPFCARTLRPDRAGQEEYSDVLPRVCPMSWRHSSKGESDGERLSVIGKSI